MSVEIVTKEDLEVFRLQILKDIEQLIGGKSQENKAWLRCNEVRKLLNVSGGTLQNMRISGKLRSHKVGGIHFYRFSDIEAMLSGKV